MMKSSYSTVFSLGAYCQTSYQLKRKNLRNFSGPLDWMISHSLSNVNQLINTRFKDFMDCDNLTILGQTNDGTYIVKDNLYNVESLHDFPIVPISKDPLFVYPVFKATLDRRINNFMTKVRTSDSILFVRMVASYDEVVELKSILEKWVKKDYNLLIINFSTSSGVIERDWGLEHVRSFEIQDTFPVRWQGCDSSWDQILEGIYLHS
jgi:hypothetical protein